MIAFVKNIILNFGSIIKRVFIKYRNLLSVNRNIFKSLIILCFMFLSIDKLLANSSEKIEVSVTLTASASIWIGDTGYDFNSLDANTTSISASSISVRNNSTSLITKWQLSASVTTISNPVTLLENWDGSSGNIASNNIGLQAMFAATRPLDASFSQSSMKDTLTSSAKVYDDTNNYFIGNSGGQNANYTDWGGIAVDDERYLWFRIKMPPQIINPVQTIEISITAEQQTD